MFLVNHQLYTYRKLVLVYYQFWQLLYQVFLYYMLLLQVYNILVHLHFIWIYQHLFCKAFHSTATFLQNQLFRKIHQYLFLMIILFLQFSDYQELRSLLSRLMWIFEVSRILILFMFIVTHYLCGTSWRMIMFSFHFQFNELPSLRLCVQWYSIAHYWLLFWHQDP